MPVEVHSIQGVLWKAKKGVAATGWKKHWVYADNFTIRQWSGKTKPAKGEEPKYTMNVNECEIKPSSIRKFAFEVTEKSTGKSMIFAADEGVSYRKWLKILTEKMSFMVRRDDEKSSVVEESMGTENDNLAISENDRIDEDFTQFEDLHLQSVLDASSVFKVTFIFLYNLSFSHKYYYIGKVCSC